MNATALHEAAHAVIAHALTGKAGILLLEGGGGRFLPDAPIKGRDAYAVALAGGMATRCAGLGDTVSEGDARHAAGAGLDQAARVNGAALAAVLVGKLWHQITTLAGELEKRRVMPSADVLKVIASAEPRTTITIVKHDVPIGQYSTRKRFNGRSIICKSPLTPLGLGVVASAEGRGRCVSRPRSFSIATASPLATD